MTSTCYLVLIPTLIVDYGVRSVCAECVNVPLDCFCEWRARGNGDAVMLTPVLILQLNTPNPFACAVIPAEL